MESPNQVSRNEDEEDLFLSLGSEASGRAAVVEGDGYSVWLYLTAPGQQRPVADGIVCSLVPPTDELVSPYGDGGPPVLLRKHASDMAVQTGFSAGDIGLLFSQDGHSVAVILRGEPWAYISHTENRGYSKGLSLDGPFGHPWDQEEFDRLFERGV
ncbi:hypothetical protein llg_25350 [Luteolibacter sp. LG18]|nr:hypothetical protein llg_25350 [Luteolibacter sp. LG18]